MFLRDDLAGVSHVPVLERAPEAVMDQKVNGRLIPQAITVACTWHRIGNVRHRFHSAGDNEIGVAEPYRLGRQRYGTQPGTADHVHGKCGYFRRKTRLHRRLARRSLTDTGLNYTSHDHFVDFRGIDSRSLDRFLDRDRSKLRRRKALQRALKLPRRRPRRTDYYRL